MKMNKCKHTITYYGAINLFENKTIVGVIDVYHCRKCKTLFTDLRRIGIPEFLESKIGFEELKNNNDWFILICKKNDKIRFSLIQSEINKEIKHVCFNNKEITFNALIEDQFYQTNSLYHKLIRIRKYINKEVELI